MSDRLVFPCWFLVRFLVEGVPTLMGKLVSLCYLSTDLSLSSGPYVVTLKFTIVLDFVGSSVSQSAFSVIV